MRVNRLRVFVLSLSALGVLSLSAAGPTGVDSWSASQLKDFEKSLAAKMSPQKVASQTLATYANHNMLVAHREGNGQGEVHERQVDVMVGQSGEAIVRVGGELVDGRQTRPHEMIGSAVRGGVEKRLGPGDVLHIPAKTPHQMMVASGQQVTYFVVKIDTP